MAAGTITITIRIKTAWWVCPYIQSVSLFAAMLGLQPNVEKVVQTALRGIRFEVQPCR